MPKSFYFGTDAELYTGAQNFSSLITATPAAFGLSAAQATAYAALVTTYNAAYLAAINPTTKTRVTVAAKDAARHNLRVNTGLYAKIIDGTATVTDAQKIQLGLVVRAQPSPIPPPSVRPAVDVVSVFGRAVKIHIHDSVVTSNRGKPAGVLGASVYSFVGETYPSDPTTWQFEGTTTERLFQVQFPETVAGGSKVWITAAWFNKRTEPGPVAVPVMTMLQGGMSAEAA